MIRRNRTTVLLLVAVELTVTAGCAIQAPREETSDEPQAEVEVFLDSYLGAIARRNGDTLRALLAGSDRYLWAELGEVRYRSPDEVIAGLESFPPEMPIDTELEQLHVSSIGHDGAFAGARFRTRMAPANRLSPSTATSPSPSSASTTAGGS